MSVYANNGAQSFMYVGTQANANLSTRAVMDPTIVSYNASAVKIYKATCM
jgi:hypothetical protein